MSRAPKVEPVYNPLHTSIGSKDVIDFVDNSLQTLAPGVMGGPPAYLEAHGVRYVPATELSSDSGGLVSMSTGASVALEPDPRRERAGLNSRIREFLQTDEFLQAPYRDRSDDYAPMPRYRPSSQVGALRAAMQPPVCPRGSYRPSPRSLRAGGGAPSERSSHTARSERLLAELREPAPSTPPSLSSVTPPGVASRLHCFDY
jgi:hypothetical protein